MLKTVATLAAFYLVGHFLVTIGFPAAYKWAYPTYAVRYRLTVNAQIDGQTRTESGVVEMHVKLQPRSTNMRFVSASSLGRSARRPHAGQGSRQATVADEQFHEFLSLISSGERLAAERFEAGLDSA